MTDAPRADPPAAAKTAAANAAAAPRKDPIPFARLLALSLSNRKTLIMFALGIASGLPYAIFTGTINAWLTQENIPVATIGVFSWVGLAYAFKFIWSPIVNLPAPLFLNRLGRRRGWIIFCQAAVALAVAMVALTDPGENLPLIALAAVIGVFAAATQDIAIDAWRIESADAGAPLDVLSAVVQFGFRIAAFAGGAGVLLLVDLGGFGAGWNGVFFLVAILIVGVIGATLAAPEPAATTNARREPAIILGARLSPRARNLILIPVLAAWGWAAFTLFSFMAATVAAETPPSARAFTLTTGPWIVAACVLLPALAAALLLRLDARAAVEPARPWPGQAALDSLYRAILEPMVDIIDRLGAAAILILILVLSYRYTDLVWGAFAYPFYLGQNAEIGALGHTLTEVALASKTIGVVMVLFGIALGAAALLRFGRMPTLIAGAILAASTNLLYADLARDAAFANGFLSLTRLDHFYAFFGVDLKLARLITVIAAENLAVGFASAASVAFVSSIVNPRFAAVQYALLASLTMLLGSLGRGALGELIEARGYAFVFVLTALMGLVAVAASIAEYIRLKAAGRLQDEFPYLRESQSASYSAPEAARERD